MAQEIKNTLANQRQEWIEQRLKLNSEQESLEERETVHVAASVYLVVTLPPRTIKYFTDDINYVLL